MTSCTRCQAAWGQGGKVGSGGRSCPSMDVGRGRPGTRIITLHFVISFDCIFVAVVSQFVLVVGFASACTRMTHVLVRCWVGFNARHPGAPASGKGSGCALPDLPCSLRLPRVPVG